MARFQDRFGGNLVAYLLAGGGLLIGAICLFLALSLDDKPICNPGYAGQGSPTGGNTVIAGVIIERRSKVDACQQMIIRIQGNKLDRFVPGEVAFQAAANNPPLEVTLTLNNLPARYDELKPGTRLQVLYSGSDPLAFSFPTGATTGKGLELGSDNRADYSRTRWIYVIVAVMSFIMGTTVLLVAWRWPVASKQSADDKPRRPLFYDPEDLPPE